MEVLDIPRLFPQFGRHQSSLLRPVIGKLDRGARGCGCYDEAEPCDCTPSNQCSACVTHDVYGGFDRGCRPHSLAAEVARLARDLAVALRVQGGATELSALIATVRGSGSRARIPISDGDTHFLVSCAQGFLSGNIRPRERTFRDSLVMSHLIDGHIMGGGLIAALRSESPIRAGTPGAFLCKEETLGVGGGASYSCSDTGCRAAALLGGHDGGQCWLKSVGDSSAWEHPGCTCRFWKAIKREVPWWVPWAVLLALIIWLLSGGSATPVLVAAGLGVFFDLEWQDAPSDSGGAAVQA